MSRDERLDRILRTMQFNCDRCTLLTQCASCQALERAFNAAPVGRDWLAWARDQRVPSDNARNLLIGLARRVDVHGFTHDSLAHFAQDAGLPRYAGDPDLVDIVEKHDRELGQWAWRYLRELVTAGLVEASVSDPSMPTEILWIRLREPEWPRVWRETFAA